MVGSRTVTALAGLAVSLGASVALWWYFGSPVFFLFVPFVPFLLRGGGDDRRPPARSCPRCGFRARDPSFEFCPRDGSRLDVDGHAGPRRE